MTENDNQMYRIKCSHANMTSIALQVFRVLYIYIIIEFNQMNWQFKQTYKVLFVHKMYRFKMFLFKMYIIVWKKCYAVYVNVYKEDEWSGC